ncbi:amidohydrolase family protein [Thermodesulfobacteriota bacterium]
MKYQARFVVDTHAHVTTLYQPAGEKSMKIAKEGNWSGMNGEVEVFDNSRMTLYDMERYGVDMAILLPSMIGTTNEKQAELVEKHPDKFRACCSDQKIRLRAWRGEEEWTIEKALKEVDEALKTGKYVGIGEFSPGLGYRMVAPEDEKPDFEERVDEYRGVMELARKYDVPVHFHDFTLIRPPNPKWDWRKLLETVASEHPDVNILLNHGYYVAADGEEGMKDLYSMVASLGNIYMETGGWSERQFEIALDEAEVSVARLMWGHDSGNVPQFLIREKHLKKYSKVPGMGEGRKTASVFGFNLHGFPIVPTYQPDFYAWGLRTINRISEWVTQDELSLILGGTAVKLYKLPIPYSRMFPEGRPDIFGDDYEEQGPFIPDDQIQNPESKKLPFNYK